MQRYWINTISKNHVLIGVENGIIQTGHGKRPPLARLKKDDWVVFYSPKQSYEGNEKLQAFTAIGQIADDEIYQVEINPDFKPFRRKISFKKLKETSILPLIEQLSFIKDKKHWGFMFRFGLFEIPEEDFKIISRPLLNL